MALPRQRSIARLVPGGYLNRPAESHRTFIERLVIAIAVAAVALLLWTLRDLIILVFGAVLVAVILGLIAGPIRERLRVPAPLALMAAVVIALAVIGSAFWLFGSEVAAQSTALRETIPRAWEAMLARLDQWGIGEPLRQGSATLGRGSGVLGNLGALALTIGNGIADTLLVVVAGIYLAAQPDLYWDGMIKLIPRRGRALAADALEASARALRLWLLGRLVSMATVGVLTWLGLTLIGVPSALTLGLLAALLEFIPFLGPVLAALPALLLAFAAGPDKAIWTLGLFVAVQQFEGNVLEPLVQQRAVSLPPALLLFALVAGGLAFGTAGIILAAPLTVVLFVMVKRLYVQEALHTATPLPGEAPKRRKPESRKA
ncbi:MAG: AI-2E family transporter [Sphingosinicella sp.]